MRDKLYDELAIERTAKEYFGVNVEVRQLILLKIPVSRTAQATVFLTATKQLFVFIKGQSKLSLGDIKKIISRMGLKAELYIPPKSRPDYFNEIGRMKFRDVFPGRKNINDDEIHFYKLLAPYNPALVQINGVKDGHVYQFDSDSNTDWRVAAKFAYRRIRTS